LQNFSYLNEIPVPSFALIPLNKTEYFVFWRGARPCARTRKYRSYL